MTLEELKNLSINTLIGAGALEAADIARHTITGKGQSWLPNSVAAKQGIPNPSTTNWWKAGKMPFSLKGSFLGAKPTMGGTAGLIAGAGLAGYEAGNAFLDSDYAKSKGVSRKDMMYSGRNLYNFLNSLRVNK